MAQARTALDHLHDARAALADEAQRVADEAQRLADALTDLDSLISTMGGELGPAGSRANPVKAAIAPGRTATRSTARKPAGRRSATRRPPSRPSGDGEAPKSIRVHVLEMLGADNRDFSLAEIIDDVHDAGIQAHDDAVRSITIKLMKDGRVERVGRGQYRLARRGGSRPAAEAEAAESADTESTGTESATAEFGGDAGGEPTATDSATESADESSDGPPEGTFDYAPPLNLTEPWNNEQG
jgi:hypothetical protein